MRIALLTLTRGTVSGGYAKYLRELVPRLAVRVDELRVFVPPEMARLDPTYRSWSGFSSLRRELSEWKPDVAFIPSAVHLDLGVIPVVTMIRNMEPLERPLAGNAPAEALRNLFRAAAARRACRRSQRVIAVSEHVRDFLVRRWSIDPARVGIVYHGVDRPAESVCPRALDGAQPFLFTAGSIRPARGVEDIIGLPHLVAIAGGVDAGAERYARRLRREIARAGMTGRVIWLGRITPEEMSWCFANAALFVMTSRAEACPNTVLEALVHGCLSVSTDQPPMPEFYRDSAIYYRGGDRRALARAVEEAMSLPAAAAAELRARALARSRDFTWDRTAEATVRELQRALE